MKPARQVEADRQDAIRAVNGIANTALKALSELEVDLHEEGYHDWSRKVSTLRSVLDTSHHATYDLLMEGSPDAS